jgi:alpha-glucosidase
MRNAWLLLIPVALAARTVVSPDGLVVADFALKGRPEYRVTYRGRPLVLASGLGLTFEETGAWGSGLALRRVKENRHSGSWRPVYGERSVIPDNYTEAVFDLEEQAAPGRRIQIVIRAYNEGAALRYVIPAQQPLARFTIASEQTEFRIPNGTRAWETHGAQSQYENVWTHEIMPKCERPLAIEYPGGGFAAVAEAGLRDYARMLLSPVPGQPGSLVSDLDGHVTGEAPFATPWRVVIAADRPGDLLERNYLLLNLNQPSRIADTSWIKPGRVMREVTLSTKGAKECIDFAKAHRIEYVEFDAGWYGHEYDEASDATGVNVDPLRLQKDPAYQGLDLKEVIRYASGRGIGIWLYVNRRALEKQLPVILPLYQQWGIKGVKYGFVNVGSQRWTKWLYDAVELAAKHHLMVDIHDEHRPTGLSRTWPNLLTQEGIHGNEEMPPPVTNTVLPFTRFVAGAADYTICYYVDRIKTTRSHQLALPVIYYSPLQFLYWYDRPSSHQGEPETEFFDRVPTVWDETRVIDGRIGRYISVARRSGSHWYVGTITNGVGRKLSIPLSFLTPGRKYTAHIYENKGRDAKAVAMSVREVDSASTVEASMPPGGGQAVWIEAR